MKKRKENKNRKTKRKTLKNRQKLSQPSIEPLQNNIQVDINPMNEPVEKTHHMDV